VADTAPRSRSVDVSESDFPTDSPVATVRMCIEPGCDNPSKKRGRGYAKWCDEHLFNHPNSGDDTPPKSRVIVREDKSKVAKKAEDQIKNMLGFAQLGFAAKGDGYCAWAIGEVGEDIAKNGGILASNIKWMANFVDKGENTFAIALLIMNLSKLGLMIGVHHDVVPYTGVVKMLVPKPPPKEVGTVVPIRVNNLVNGSAVDATVSDNPSFT
jgi:hypothetical protein